MIWLSDKTLHITGHCTATTAARTMWPDNTIITTPVKYMEVWVASTNANDTLLGTGARGVRIEGLDNKGVPLRKDIELNGQTPVLATEFKWVQSISVSEVGSNGSNLGIIYAGSGVFTTGVPAVKYELIPIGEGVPQTIRFTVPTGMRLTIEYIESKSTTSANDYTLQLCVQNDVTGFRIVSRVDIGSLQYLVQAGETVSLRVLNSTAVETIYAKLIGRLELTL